MFPQLLEELPWLFEILQGLNEVLALLYVEHADVSFVEGNSHHV